MASYNPTGKEVPFAQVKAPEAPTPAFQAFQNTKTGSVLDPYAVSPVAGPADQPGPVSKFGEKMLSGAQTYFLTKALYDVGHQNTPNHAPGNKTDPMGRRMRRQMRKQRWNQGGQDGGYDDGGGYDEGPTPPGLGDPPQGGSGDQFEPRTPPTRTRVPRGRDPRADSFVQPSLF